MLERMIETLAKRDTVPVATKARQLIENALLLEEDRAIAKLVKSRDKSDKLIAFDTIWKKYMR